MGRTGVGVGVGGGGGGKVKVGVGAGVAVATMTMGEAVGGAVAVGDGVGVVVGEDGIDVGEAVNIAGAVWVGIVVVAATITPVANALSVGVGSLAAKPPQVKLAKMINPKASHPHHFLMVRKVSEGFDKMVSSSPTLSGLMLSG